MSLWLGTLSGQITGSSPPAKFLLDGAVAGPNGKYYLFITESTGSYTNCKAVLDARGYGSSVYVWQPTTAAEQSFASALGGGVNLWMGIIKPNITTPPYIWTYDEGAKNNQEITYQNWRVSFPTTTTTVAVWEASDGKWTSRADGGSRSIVAEWSPT